MKNIWKPNHPAVHKMTKNIVWNEVRVIPAPHFVGIVILGHVRNMQSANANRRIISVLSD